MQITDIEGQIIEVTHLEKAIQQADFFKDLRHENPAYKERDDYLQKYWADIHKKSLKLKNET